jgi:pimeloyl-ACP methyl ester carboxylesterase
MSASSQHSGMASVGDSQLYYEVAGEGTPFVMIHAGVADHRQWNNEFAHFAEHYKVVRYDMRGFGKSEPADSAYKPLDNLVGLLAHLKIEEPIILMGCSMGGSLAFDFALAYPERIKALIMVGSEPDDLDLDVPSPKAFEAIREAYKAGDWDKMAELETDLWFVGETRTRDEVDATMYQLAYAMGRQALRHEEKGLGKRLPNLEPSADTRLDEITCPLLLIIGAHDIEYMKRANDVVEEAIPSAQKVVMENAAHLANMDEPAQFQRIVGDFLAGIGDG